MNRMIQRLSINKTAHLPGKGRSHGTCTRRGEIIRSKCSHGVILNPTCQQARAGQAEGGRLSNAFREPIHWPSESAHQALPKRRLLAVHFCHQEWEVHLKQTSFGIRANESL